MFVEHGAPFLRIVLRSNVVGSRGSESHVGDGIRFGLALGARSRSRPCRPDELGTGLRARLEAHGVPLIAALPGRTPWQHFRP